MTPDLDTKDRSFIEAIDDLIAKHPEWMRVMAEADSRAGRYSRERYLTGQFALVHLPERLIHDDTISGCEQVMAHIAARLIAAHQPHWSNHDWNKPIALLGYLLNERRRHAELVAAQHARSLANIFREAAE
jgi:hypothetical protein